MSIEGSIRIGFGYDIHPLRRGRKLILAGVEIPSELGLEGHSDADVLVHSICDALLGSGGLADIGEHFPNSDERLKGVSSLSLLKKVREMIEKEGWSIENIDSSIITEKPNLSPFKERMRENIARVLRLSLSCVNIKAGSNEGLGAIGKGEGICAYAVVLIRRKR
ncbi:MAG: 2-C-methyl-D-erythritol 2,4-cyclodiphosphate synthase [Candidatus Omnitrophota bacterium]|nr:MAG: 2-C-methyl-D-erythritol 2,4-cyclodiphosphate synthase [Candidatus Omnitrophota bacterium]